MGGLDFDERVRVVDVIGVGAWNGYSLGHSVALT